MSRPVRTLLFCVAMAVAGASAAADDLGNANVALQQKNYPTALQLFGQLAAGGNPEAQLRLGEMYWYGEGVALDRAKGDALFAQAAAKGNQEALAATSLSARRAARSADIAWWTSDYQGLDLTSGQWRCTPPVIAQQSSSNADIKATSDAIKAWSDCYNGFVDHVSQALPPGKAIPGDLLELMSELELAQSRAHLDQVYARVLADAKARADATLARRDAWEKATQAYAKTANAQVAADSKLIQDKLERDQLLRQSTQGIAVHRPTPRAR